MGVVGVAVVIMGPLLLVMVVGVATSTPVATGAGTCGKEGAAVTVGEAGRRGGAITAG